MLSIGSAVGSGFTLIGRRFVSVIVWGVALYFSILILFGVGWVAVGGPAAISHLGTPPGGTATPQQVIAMMVSVISTMWLGFALAMIGGLFLTSIVQGAVFRSVLTPDQKSFFSMRFGGRELSLLLLNFVILFFAVLAYLASAIIIGGVVYAATRIQGAVGVLIVVLFCIAYLIALLWVALRFSLAAPMTFAEGRVRFFGSWAMTRGHGWGMVGLAIVIVLAAFGVSFAIQLLSSIFTAIFAGGAVSSIEASSGGQDATALLAHWPMLLLAYLPTLILGAVSQGLLQAITQAPWMDVYRQLRPQPDVATTFT